MKVLLLALLQASAFQVANAERVDQPVLLRALPAGTVVGEADFAPDGAGVEAFVGKETRRFLPAGATVSATDLRAPLLVRRNKPVRMAFVKGALLITAEGRALADGALGETVRVINLASKTAVAGVVVEEGVVEVR